MQSKVFVASDTHFGHANIIRYTDRPFGSVYHMDTALIERWNSRVACEDTVYFLGDLAMGRGVDAAYVLNVLSQLNGELKIILGNHDLPSKWSPGLEAYIEGESTSPEVLGKESITIQHDGKSFLMYHYPMEDWDGRFNGVIHLHGHCHGRVTDLIPEGVEHPAASSQTPNGKWLTSIIPPQKGRYDVGVDSYGGPVELTGDLRYLDSPKGWK